MKNLILSVHKINDASLCPRLFLFSSIIEYEPIIKPDYLESGDLYHKLLEYHYKVKIDKKIPIKSEIINQGRNEAAKRLDLSSELVEETIKLYSEYADHYQHENWTPIHVEEPFIKLLFEDQETRIMIEGKIDLIALAGQNQAKIVVDHKKTGREWEQFDRDNQKIAYCWATDINDFVINSCGTQKSKKIDDRMKRSYFTYSPHQIEEWKDNTIELANEVLTRMEKKSFPGRYVSCVKFGHKCAFYEVCNSPAELWNFKLTSEFKKKTHDLFKNEEVTK